MKSYSFSEIESDLAGITLDPKPTPQGHRPMVGQRNNFMFSLCARWQDDGMPIDEQLKRLRANNATLEVPLPDEELQHIVNSVQRYEPDRLQKEIWTSALSKSKPNTKGTLALKERKNAAKPSARPATRQEYWELIKLYFDDSLRRDILTDVLMYWDKTRLLWSPCENRIASLRSHMRFINESQPEPKFNPRDTEDHLSALKDTLTPRLCVEVPEWDGRDRIKELCKRIQLDLSRGLDANSFEELVKDWHGLLWRKLSDNTVQNRLMVLVGPQWAGKDFWIDENIAALGQFANPLHIEGNVKDARLQLSQSLVCTISEFDRTAKMEAATLKALITDPASNLRAPYAPRHEYQRVPCSLIASCNTADLLTDYTGNRRYIVAHVLKIDKSTRFSEEDRLQVLAQGQYLAKNYVPASQHAEELLSRYLRRNTPANPEIAVPELLDDLATAIITSDDFKAYREAFECNGSAERPYNGFLPASHIATSKVRDLMIRATGLRPKRIDALLTLAERTGKKRGSRGLFFNFTDREKDS